MISHVSSTTPINQLYSPHTTAPPKAKPAPPPPKKEDSVQLSSVAKAYGDVDHGGDGK